MVNGGDFTPFLRYLLPLARVMVGQEVVLRGHWTFRQGHEEDIHGGNPW